MDLDGYRLTAASHVTADFTVGGCRVAGKGAGKGAGVAGVAEVAGVGFFG